eukprot:TRINITY_DN8975_c0_g1_i1.p1 TRINITY_DN8975_c0_g1~~TRINITY_DN8975_c0_g1_i1.p1  ORF type:complete len:157 (-),score=33.42 TRINITY_DN8975_c0_g1_i1:343-813(-)
MCIRDRVSTQSTGVHDIHAHGQGAAQTRVSSATSSKTSFSIEVASGSDRMPSWSDNPETGLLNDQGKDYGAASINRSLYNARVANETQGMTLTKLQEDRLRLVSESKKAQDINEAGKQANEHLGRLECQKRWDTVLWVCIIMQAILALALGIYVFS